MDQTIVVAAYATIGSELKQLQRTSWIATAYMLTVTSFQPLYGKLSDIFGRKAVLLSAYAIFAFGSLACGLARNLDQLILGRALAGIGGGGMTTIVSIILSDVVPLCLRGKWQGYVNIIYTCGSISGAPLGGVLTDYIGWRWVFMIQAPIALIAMFLVSFYLHLPRVSDSDFSAKLKRIDVVGSIALVISIFALLMAFDHGGNISWMDNTTYISIGVFALASASFILVEAHLASEPIVPLKIIFDKYLLGAYLSNFFGVAVMMTIFFYMPLFGWLVWVTWEWFYYAGAILLLFFTGLAFHSGVGVAIDECNNNVWINKGAGTTTALIALISNAGQENQAMATAASYLFRSLGGIIGVSFGNTIEQQVLQKSLKRRLSGNDINKIIQCVRESLNCINMLEPSIQAVVQDTYSLAVQTIMVYVLIAAALALMASIFIQVKNIAN
ncbi:Vacuolar membrane amino acid uptake transporter fnx2 [Leucoagaricus sp. SymC.cos]|nr:Vacuolar membrane amino acid uptake transporter fnx2 [Leucoagaricus sp. SymC.cos]